MTIHKKRTKTFYKLFIIALCLFLSIFILITYSNKRAKINKKINENKIDAQSKDSEIKGEEQATQNTKLTKIAFEKNNNIYLYDEINEEIKSVGDDAKSKDLLTLSPDKAKIAFRYFNEGKATYPPHVIVYDIANENITDIVVQNKNTQQVVELKWIDNEDVLIMGHINPSASGYAVYNIKSKAELLSCVGTIRDVTLDKKNILYSSTPHIFPPPKANLYINDNKVFEAINDKEEIFDGVLSSNGKMLAFRSSVASEDDLNSEVDAYLNVAKVNSDGKAISDLKKISISSDTTGNIKFDSENNVNIVGDEFIYKLKDDKLIKEQNTLPKQPELSDEQLKKFKQVLGKQFPEELITDETLLEDVDINNVVAF
jgi:hypothetical protein